MPHPPLDAQQTAQALQAYRTAREQAVRYVLSALDPTAFDAPALPYDEVLVRVYDLLGDELVRYLEQTPVPTEEAPPAAAPEERTDG
jgi:hypothetical protein